MPENLHPAPAPSQTAQTCGQSWSDSIICYLGIPKDGAFCKPTLGSHCTMYIRARLQKSPCSASADNTVWKGKPFHIHQPALAVCRLSAQAWAAGFYPVSLALLKFLAVLVRPCLVELVLRHDGPGYPNQRLQPYSSNMRKRGTPRRLKT